MSNPPAPFALAGATSQKLAGPGGGWLLDLWVPDSPSPAGGFPLVLLLDGEGCFATCVEAVKRMGRRPDATAVVPLVVAALRADGPDPLAQRQLAFTTPQGDKAGDADRFLAFLRDDVLPLIAARAAIDPARRTLFGHSLAGYFSLWALGARRPGSEQPPLFTSHAAISPSVWWDRAGLETRLSMLPADGRQVLLCLGEWEDALPPWQQAAPGADTVRARRASRQMKAGFEAIAALLTRQLGADRVHTCFLADEDHASIVSAAIPRMLRMACRTF